jgi:hypothetical protein
MSVRFFGPVGEHTGYGVAVSNFAKAFSRSGVKTKFLFNENSASKRLLKELNQYTGNTTTDFYLHCPPYNKHQSRAYKIGYFYWEADRLPKHWARDIKQLNELWVPCNLVKEACIRARFNGPIKVIPTPCSDLNKNGKKIHVPSLASNNYVLNDDVYKFYSIFQWQNRKGYDTLINSYYRAFTKTDNVILILKVNPLNIGSYTENKIRADILEIKRKLNLKYYAPIYLSSEVVDGSYIQMLHNSGDCYVSPHHGEGWGMPIHDAMLMEKQLIVTQYGGVTEYLDENSAHIIKHKTGPVTGMEWSPLYESYQSWAYPSAHHLSVLFREVYENHKFCLKKGVRAREIAETMTIDSVSKIIKKELGA